MAARLTVDLAALAANYRRLERTAPLGAVIKADAYGLGAQRVFEQLRAIGCEQFFVATLDEALALPADGTVYVFEGPRADDVARYVPNHIRPVLNSAAQIALWRQAGTGPAALHVDTGMQRLGVPWTDVSALRLDGVTLCLLMTHYACADTPEHPLNAEQQTRIADVARMLPQLPTSYGNSAALLNGAELKGADWVGDMGRPGIALYGGAARADVDDKLQPVATLEGRVLQVREAPAGSSLGYGATATVSVPKRIATVGVGYADGVPRLLSNCGRLYLNGSFCPILGRVSMDAVQIDVTGVHTEAGDWAEVFGPHVAIDEVAAHADTIAYEVLTGISSRPARRYLTAA